MARKPAHEELEQRIRALEKKTVTRRRAEEELLETIKRVEIAYDQSIIYAQQLNEEIAERKRAEEALQKAHRELERRVEVRTAELSRTNTLLEKEIGVRKRMEGQLRKLNEELKSFVGFVSHELVNPITYIQGFSSFLLDNYQGKLGENVRVCLERIKANSRRMEVLVCDLLTLSSIGKLVPIFSHVPSREIVRNVTATLQDILKEKGIKVVVADNLPTIYCDKERIFQVFENLFVNAIKFTRDTKNPRIEVEYENTGSHQFCVRDNGIGIDPRYHRRIFEMFQRLKEMKDEEGSGLGLSIVEKIVNDHGGRIWVESEKGKGAAFYFVLPESFDS
jgi:signal transduction histidine kinase